MKKIAIFCGGPSSEHEVSLSSAQSILDNIDKKKYELFVFYIKKNFKSAFYKADKTIKPPKNAKFSDFEKNLKNNKDKFDLALLCALHGEFGEDGTIQMILENLGIKYTGSDSKSSSLCMDKDLSTSKVKKIKNLYFPKTKKLKIEDIDSKPPLKFPFIIKPNDLGSSVLVFIVKNQKAYESAIKKINQSKVKILLFQELISGIEFSCGCLQEKNDKFIELPPIEIIPNSAFFNYKSKYVVGGATEITPPISISKKESDRISKLTIEIHKELKCRTYSRSDFMYRDGKIYFLETNTLPGMTATSLLPQEANAKKINFSQLLDFIINQSL